MKCQDCNYYSQSTDPFWNGKEHCCFREWGHADYEIAPCDDPDFDDEEEPDYE